MSKQALRVGAVSYLNTKPLISHLPGLSSKIELSVEIPSLLATQLEAGQIDIGLIPSIEYFRAGHYTMLPNLCIGSYGPVMSVKLCSRVPFEKIQTVALDGGSRTSIALCAILLDELFGVKPQTIPLPMSSEASKTSTDAVLVIGDRAMKIGNGAFPFTLDLGYEWSRWTGLPFVFAFYAVRPGVKVPAEVQRALEKAKDLGRRAIPEICQQEAQRLGIDEFQCRYYLQSVIRHDLGPAELEGLTRFYQLASARGLAPQGVDCVFHGNVDFAKSC